MQIVIEPFAAEYPQQLADTRYSQYTYPNPATNNLHINLSLDKPDDYTITIITALGQQAKQLFTGKTGGLSADYNINSLEGGLYFVEALSADSRKIIKLSIIR